MISRKNVAWQEKLKNSLVLGYMKSALKIWQPAPTVGKNKGMPGEMGKAVQIPKEREEEKKEKFKINQFNLLASEMIALNRSLADVRLSA